MGWLFGVLQKVPKIEYLENSQVIAEVSKSREKARTQCPTENINRGIFRTLRRGLPAAGVIAVAPG
jgi:hypothetical protein